MKPAIAAVAGQGQQRFGPSPTSHSAPCLPRKMASEPALRATSSSSNNSETDPAQKKKRRRRGGRKRNKHHAQHQQPDMPAHIPPTVFPQLPMTPTSSRYPSTLSQRPGPSRYNRPIRPGPPPPRDTPESVDDAVPPVVPLAEILSLADLLKQAGYKETRVFTPENEKRKVIKRTFDDDDEEVQALYGAFGLVPSDSNMHTRQTITEPSLPLKSSSSLLRSLALKEIAGGVDNDDRRRAIPSNDDHAWWGGGLAAGLSRAAKAVMEMSPPNPSTPAQIHTEQMNEERARELHASVGLDLVRGGEGVRKVKSDMVLDRTLRDDRQQEDRPPVNRCRSDSPPERSYRQFFVTPPPEASPLVFTAPPPPALDEDAFGYSPLPEDYEAQCDEDDSMYGAIDAFQVGSLGSSRSRTSTRSRASVCSARSAQSRGSSRSRASTRASTPASVDSTAVLDLSLALGSMSTIDSKGPGARIMMDAVDYDDVEDNDSPESVTIALPDVGEEDEDAVENEIIDAYDAYDSDENEESDDDDGRPPSPRYREWSVGSERPIPLAMPPRAIKYSDRAARLRSAKSTPALAQKPSWLGSLRAAVLGQHETYEPVPTSAPAQVSKFSAPIKITPATPAAPALVSATPIICDSASNEAEDLPAIPTVIANAVPNRSFVPLRVKSSLAALRSAVGFSGHKASESGDDTPTLKPRMDWKTQGSQFAGWTWDKSKESQWSSEEASVEVDNLTMGMRVVSGATIDYSQSFFYKPTTPPHPSTKRAQADANGKDAESVAQAPASSSKGKETGNLGKRRSVKSLKAALLLPVAPPPVPPIPQVFVTSVDSTPPPSTPPRKPSPPMLAISSPGAWEAGLPPRELVLEGEEWDAKDGGTPGDWGRKAQRPRRLSKARV